MIKRFVVVLFSVLFCLPLTPALPTPDNWQKAAAQETATEQSFFAPESWALGLTYNDGWKGEHPRLLADVNGDGKQDVVGFGYHGVWTALSTGDSFAPA
jgi:hypothetical protein